MSEITREAIEMSAPQGLQQAAGSGPSERHARSKCPKKC